MTTQISEGGPVPVGLTEAFNSLVGQMEKHGMAGGPHPRSPDPLDRLALQGVFLVAALSLTGSPRGYETSVVFSPNFIAL